MCLRFSEMCLWAKGDPEELLFPCCDKLQAC